MLKILIMGLPGAGKTTLANELVPLLGAVHFNGDDIRQNICKDLGFSNSHRVLQATRMGHMCDLVAKSGTFAVADFICPTEACRTAFNADFVVWVDRIQQGRYADTNIMFEKPAVWDLRLPEEYSPRAVAQQIYEIVVPTYDSRLDTAFVLGRFQPFHDGHLRLIEKSLERCQQVCIAVRDTFGADPWTFQEVRQSIDFKMKKYVGRYTVQLVPNITDIFYGRDVGYNIEEIDLDEETKAISATNIRREIGVG